MGDNTSVITVNDVKWLRSTHVSTLAIDIIFVLNVISFFLSLREFILFYISL